MSGMRDAASAARQRALITSTVAVLGAALAALCFAGYLAPAALLTLLSDSAFCG
ncbi:hypothetical protein [Trinickia terrae]|uniref:hypothetical protein n=1 Tax=Trinickia terrae TaxID=2571161 RepID=UPI00146C63E2|nr:hypothetical protein [Trinickia terrae]